MYFIAREALHFRGPEGEASGSWNADEGSELQSPEASNEVGRKLGS